MIHACQARGVAPVALAVATFEEAELRVEVVASCQDFAVGEVEDPTRRERRKRRSQERRVAHADDTRIGLHPADGDLQQRGLADAVATEDRSHLAGPGPERGRRENLALAERLAHAIGDEGVHQRRTSARTDSAGTAAAA